ncbi:MAG: double-strand break repair helicase AddA, partial [Paracoccaceae bacterium]
MSNDANQSQIAAANPARSVWLHANAGSGKTKVLIDRVARLLLSGVEPQHVLCLTYTKAAAAEMQNRLFARLGSWAMMPDAELLAALDALGPLESGKVPDIARARQLFARAIETPGGLRIQTIHSFCSTILRRFPLEAGVSPQFCDLDDRSAILMRSDIAQDIASGPHAATFDRLAQFYTADDLDALLAQIARARGAMTEFLDEDSAFKLFGVPKSETLERILSDVFLGSERAMIDTVLLHLDPQHRNEGSWLRRLSALPSDLCNLASLQALETLLLSGTDTKTPNKAKLGKFPNARAITALGESAAAWDAFMQRVEDTRPRRCAFQAATATAALHGFARHFIPEYEARKTAQGMLDFDDQITRAKDLLTDQAVAQWVLYRLDGGIDHILVDEAQDTSPDQWQVLERLSDAFMDGRSARNRARTIFVVGDMKQSIYSFQGADVAAFETMKQRFRGKLGEVGQTLQEREMLHSFRSSPAILSLVDATFDREDTASTGGRMQHLAFFDQMPGQVEVWPLIESQTAKKEEDGFSPVDLTTDEHHAVQMGKKVAEWIAAALKAGMQVPTRDGQRLARPGDFLILVRRRSKIFDAVITACKACNLPVAGADRLVLGNELAVKDLMALLSFLATDTDDLSLAAVLRSPLGGLSEDELYRLAFGRPKSLWLRLEEQAAHHAAAYAMLKALRDEADLLRPYDLLEHALTRHGGRLRLVARLGQEAEDAIDELLTQALAYESAEVPSITGFLSWLTAGDVQVKRQMESGGSMIRVMTVHGAKGLEAPVVILPDTADYSPQDRDQVIKLTSHDERKGANRAAN